MAVWTASAGHMDCGGGVLILVAHTGVKGDAGEQRGGGLAGADDLVAVEVAVGTQRPVGGVEVRLYQRGIWRAVTGEADVAGEADTDPCVGFAGVADLGNFGDGGCRA